MAIASDFEDIIHDHLKVHAAWLPVTNPYRLGDYGLISGGVFQKIGNIKDDFSLSFTESSGQDATLNFVSDSTLIVDASTGAQVNLNPTGTIQANVTFKFQNEKSFLINAPVINVSIIENVNQVFNQLKQLGQWRRKYAVVFQVYVAQNPLILSTLDGGTEVTIGGSGDALQQFNIGNATANFSLKTTKALGLEVTGKTGPIALGLFKLNWLTGDLQLLGKEEDVELVNLNKAPLTDDI